ncbi:MAG TPA: hypothetical protein VHY84_13700 [Bryobacteraceae bacterium]|jgi:hypothetical protein|nr:hypothetical protein [Bryobacteraceae bacterium]
MNKHAEVMANHLAQQFVGWAVGFFDLTDAPNFAFSIEKVDSTLDRLWYFARNSVRLN